MLVARREVEAYVVGDVHPASVLVDHSADRRMESIALHLGENAVVGVGPEECHPLLGRVALLPRDLALGDTDEFVDRGHLVERPIEIPLADRAREVRRVLVVDGVVVVSQRAGPLAGLVPEQGERSSRAERAPCLLVAVGALHPVPRLRREHEAKGVVTRHPILERDLLDVLTRSSEHARHSRARFERVHTETPTHEASRGLAGTGADLERSVVWLKPAVFDDRVEERVGIRRASVVVLRGHLAEDQALLDR